MAATLLCVECGDWGTKTDQLNMKSIKKRVFAVYQNDGCQGYNTGLPLALYPFASAAEASPECLNMRGYANISGVSLCCFEDVNYIYKKEIKNQDVLGACGIGVPVNAFKVEFIPKGHVSIYNNRDEFKYIIGEDKLIEFIRGDNYRVTIFKVILTRDSDEYFELEYADSFKVNSFTMSRELAIKNALGKLTEEERKLLGVGN